MALAFVNGMCMESRHSTLLQKSLTFYEFIFVSIHSYVSTTGSSIMSWTEFKLFILSS